MVRDSETVSENTIFGLLILGVAIAVMAAIPQFIQDDAYISFRYARNFVTSQELTYNIGERVEGYTNFLWVMLMALPHGLGIDAARFAHLFGSGLFILLLVVVRLAQIRFGVASSKMSWIALALLASNKNLVMACRSGLETGMFVVLVTVGTVQCLASPATTRRLMTSGLIFGLAAMTRPEGVLFFSVCFLLYSHQVMTTRGDIRTVLGFGTGFLLFFLPYCLWRFSYFGTVLPNTYYAKVGYDVRHVSTGLAYLARGLSTDEMASFIFVPFALLLRDPPRWIRGVLVLSACYLLYVVIVGGDYMEFNRFIVPVVPLLVLASFAAVSVVLKSTLGPLTWYRRWVVVLLWCGLVVFLHFPRGEWSKNIRHKASLEHRNIAIGQYFASIAQSDDLLCTEVIGAIGYHSHLPILDVHGLVDLHIARQPFETGIRKIGHEKSDLEYVLARAPRFIYAPDYVRSLGKDRRTRITAAYRSTRGSVTPAKGERFTLAYFVRRTLNRET